MELLFELLLNGLGELIVELVGWTGAQRHPAGRFVVSLVTGAVAGGISTFVFRSYLLHTDSLRLANLLVAPLFVGFVSALIAIARKRSPWSATAAAAAFAFMFAAARWQLLG